MKRRRLLIGLGSATGLTGVVGSGAFTSVSAERDVTVQTASDADAYLRMEPLQTPNGEAYATTTDEDLIALEFTDTEAGGQGVGTDSIYDFHDVFQITNQGTQPVYVWATFADAQGDFTVGDPETNIWLYANSDPTDKLRDSEDDVLYLSVGASANIGVHVETDELEQDQELTITINADADNPAEGDVVGDNGTTIQGPTDGLVSYWPLDDITSGTTADVAGTNNGSLEGDVTGVDGKIDQAIQLDGEDDYVDCGNLEIGSGLTVSAWIKPKTKTEEYNWPENLGVVAQYQSEWIFEVRSNLEGIQFWDGNWLQSESDIAENKWQHVAAVWTAGGERAIYIDGEKDVSDSNADSPFSNNITRIGYSGDRSRYFKGKIDDVRLYNRALSDDEVSDLADIS
ncbi:LamG domain-containing protein [Halalkaliarchaeum sp. AArc-GB]|uniref:LamG domain-containing protein n=1 Tax=Halalkaliarchaeum sp. AArc-GB TaxID=3074078 RepID=UPI00285EF9A1|nr:LamG domain-containing protein [Halalkaliarchaeum sp. AArc-GB]MDR5673204.1 LamG domain-containing protein [Halalkaliarchaeum sp. AArc-GB]